jgi:putative endonuclease
LNSKIWYVYLALCSDGSIYTGITTDPEKREKDHNLGKGSKYVRSRTPVKLIPIENFSEKSDALKFEFYIKKLNKISKHQIYEIFSKS